MTSSESMHAPRTRFYNDLLREIGAMTVAAAHAESSTRSLLWVMMGVPERIGKHATVSMPWETMLQRIATLTRTREELGDALRRRLLGWLKAAGQAKQRRNAIVHGVLVQVADVSEDDSPGTAGAVPNAFISHRARKGDVTLDIVPVDIDDVREIVQDLEDVWLDGYTLASDAAVRLGFDFGPRSASVP